MPLTDERIREVLSKNIKSKTILIDVKDYEEIINNHIKDGYKLVKETKINEKIKLTFQKIV